MGKPVTWVFLHLLAAVAVLSGAFLIFKAQPGEASLEMIRRGLTPQWNIGLVQLGATSIVSGIIIWSFGTVVGLLADIRDAVAPQGELAAAQLRDRSGAKTFGPIAAPVRQAPRLSSDYKAELVETPWGPVRIGDRVWDGIMTKPVQVISFLSATTLVVRRDDGDPFALEARHVVRVEPAAG
jgi:hypothetical protein